MHMQETTSPGPEIFAFGPYKLSVAERLLEREGTAVLLGSRALDLLIVLVEEAGTVLSKRDLMKRVWGDTAIEEVGLRAHIANLRKVLGDGKGAARYIINIAGRGYSFVAPLAQSHPDAPSNLQRVAIDPERRLPPRLVGMIGREEAVQSVSQEVQAHRFVTITGPGGIGKTTVAVSIAHALLEEFPGAVYFVDLASVCDPALVPGALVSALGGPIQSGDPLTGLLAFLRDKRALLLIDNCEHVIEAAASAAERIFKEAEDVCIVATSREPLRVEGERVHHLFPLPSPSPDAGLAIADALEFPAIRLFVERASAADDRFELSTADIANVAMICRMLDGIPLAIELAASQVSGYGIQGLADLIDDRLNLLTHGRRTAPPRHQTLQALLDWSYNLLRPLEQKVLCRLSRFGARFTLNAAKAVAGKEDADLAPIAAVLSSLVAKSLVSREAVGKGIRYRLLDTTREYAQAKLKANDDPNLVARRHALYLSRLLETENSTPQSDEERWLVFSEYLGDVRAALEWSFSEGGDLSIAKALARRAVQLFHELSLLSECNRWAEQALSLLRDEDRGTPSEMELQAARAVSLMFTKGNSEEVRLAFVKALALAERLNDAHYALRLNGGLHMFALRTGDFHGALRYARRCASIAEEIADGVSTEIADAMLSVSYHLAGDQANAQRHCEAALHSPALHHGSHAIHFGFDLANRARICLSRLLWLRGLPDQAVTVAQASIREAAELEHPVTPCIALIWTLPVFIWVGNLTAAEENIEWFVQHHERHHLVAYHGVGLGLRGKLAVTQGDADRGLRLLRESLAALRASSYGMITTVFTSALAEGLAMSARTAEALSTVDRQIARVQESGDLFYMPNLLRIKGDIQTSLLPDQDSHAEQTLLQSLDLARDQQALSWELRSGTSLARLYYSQGKPSQAVSILRPIYQRFTEGFSTTDLVRAREFLEVCM
jgi:predicted ATPase